MPECPFPSCLKPLGNASLEEGYSHCHEHRKCSQCGFDCQPSEITYCLANSYPITHARCLISDTSVPAAMAIETRIDLLNLCRLLIWPDSKKSVKGNEYDAELLTPKLIIHMDLEEKFIFLKKIQTIAACMSLELKKDAQAIKKEIEARESVRFEKATQEAKTSSRPTNKAPDDLYESLLASFMQMNNITDRKLGQKKWNDREKAIKSFTNLGLSREMAEQTVDKQRGLVQ